MNEQVFALVKEAVEELNEDLDYDSLESPNASTVLFDESEDSIDSLSLVTLLTDIEKQLHKLFDKEVVIADEQAMAMDESPYRSVGSLIEFIETRL